MHKHICTGTHTFPLEAHFLKSIFRHPGSISNVKWMSSQEKKKNGSTLVEKQNQIWMLFVFLITYCKHPCWFRMKLYLRGKKKWMLKLLRIPTRALCTITSFNYVGSFFSAPGCLLIISLFPADWRWLNTGHPPTPSINCKYLSWAQWTVCGWLQEVHIWLQKA